MKLEKLTPEQKDSLKEKRDFFTGKFLNNDKINPDAAIEAIAFVYSLLKKPCPQILKVVSPMQAQRLANKLKGTDRKYYSFGTYLTVYWASFYAYYETFVDFGIITEEKFPKYFKLRKFIDSNIFLTIEFENAIIICEKPMYIKKNERGMHCTTGASIEWADGYSQYYINGRAIPKKYFDSISNKTFKLEDFIKENNEEYKSTCIAMIQEKYGDEYLVNFFSKYLTEVDTYVDKKKEEFLSGTTKGMNVGVYTLFKGEINNQRIAYVRCYCPSTDRMFFLGVDNNHRTAKDAIASLYRIPTKLKPYIKSISRQGERFSTILDEKGKEILDSLSEKDITDVSGLDGKTYFEKMQYEF
jgi:hypothetical protein